MAHSLELRTPLVDFALVQELAPLLVNRPKERCAKEMLARALRRVLSPEVVDRPKTDFGLLIYRWLERSRILGAWCRQPAFAGPKGFWSWRLAYSSAGGLMEQEGG